MDSEICLCASCREQAEAMRKIIEAGEAYQERIREADDRSFKNNADIIREGAEYKYRKAFREFNFGVYA